MSHSEQDKRLKNAVDEGKLFEVRRILTGFDKENLEQINKLIKDPEAFSNQISALLPLSIRKMIDSGDVSFATLQPLVEETLKESVAKNPHILSDILFPIMMPAIRKAVSDDIKRMLDTVNNTLENSFSAKRIGWRFQALSSGKSYAEIALSNAYLYHVKQVFLIHKKTGLLLSQVQEDNTESANADMVSSMLSAIKDFVQDSFKTKENPELQTMKIGNLTILIEQGPYAIIAAVVEGNVADEYKLLLKETIENIHLAFAFELEHFKGDTTPFEEDRFVRQCLQKEVKEQKRKKPVFAIVLLLLFLLALAYLLYGTVATRLQFNKLVRTVHSTNGLIITEKGKHWFGKYYLYGLRDPMAKDPSALVRQSNIDADRIVLSFKSYLSPDKASVLKRAAKVLSPPKTVTLDYRNGTLIISGKSDSTWIKQAHKKWPLIGTVLAAEFHMVSNDTVTTKRVTRPVFAIDKYPFTFNYNVFELTHKQSKEFDSLISEIKTILNFRFNQDSVPIIIVNSYTSYRGNVTANKMIAKHRAEQFINLMVDKGLPIESLVPKVKFIEDEGNIYPIRTVVLKVKYVKPQKL